MPEAVDGVDGERRRDDRLRGELHGLGERTDKVHDVLGAEGHADYGRDEVRNRETVQH